MIEGIIEWILLYMGVVGATALTLIMLVFISDFVGDAVDAWKERKTKKMKRNQRREGNDKKA